MMNNELHFMRAARFSFFALGFVLFWWAAYFLAVEGFFFFWLIALFGVIMGTGVVIAAWKWLKEETPIAKAVIAISILCSGSLLYFAEPTFFSGRDQGSISEAAFELVRTGSLPFSFPVSETFFDIYGEGKALNFPGFFYRGDGSLATQFPLGYTVWLAAFTSFFGEDGFRIGNGLLLALSILSMFVLVRAITDERVAVGASTVFAASFLTSWFAKFTLTENAALFLFLFLSLNLFLFLREQRARFFLASLLSALMLAVTRIEGLWMLVATLVILFLSAKGQSFTARKKALLRTLPLLFVGAVLLINFFADLPFYVVMAKAALGNLSSLSSADPTTIADSTGVSLALWKLFAVYGVLPVFLIGFVGILFLLRKKRFETLLPALLALPTFLYFFDPNITHDHPWMLRRFLPFAFPALLLSGTVAVAIFFAAERKRFEPLVSRSLFLIVLLIGLPATLQTFSFADNRGFLETTAKVASDIGPRDLVLIDRNASGDPFSIPAGPLRFLHGKNAAYFFNPEDYAKIRKDDYAHIYLLTPLDAFEKWQEMPVSFEFVSGFTFSTKRLETLPLRTTRLPEKQSQEQDVALFELMPL